MGVGFTKNSTLRVLYFQPKADAFSVKNGVRANGELMITFTPKNGETTICGIAELRDLLLTFAAPRFLPRSTGPAYDAESSSDASLA